jgi:ubiquinone/menaquinone biosynthesis C-methylase UbiE
MPSAAQPYSSSAAPVSEATATAEQARLEEVRRHYETFPYPVVNPEDERTRLSTTVHEAFDRLNHYCYGGRRDFNQPFRALFAGGGTGEGLVHLAEQMRGRSAEIIYLDMSRASLEIAKKRIELRGLENVTWIQDSLLNLPQLGLGMFDYINCSGVLHHLADPDAGLKTLADALKDDGAMGLMLYAKYGRLAIYPLQEALRLINRGEPDLQKRVDNAKAILSHLPPTNWFIHSPQTFLQEIRSDAGIYDLLLHAQDQAYSMPELYRFLDGAGLHLLHLFHDGYRMGDDLYNPAAYLQDAALREKVRGFSLRDQHTLAELLHGQIYKHTFYAAKHLPTPPTLEDVSVIPLFSFDVEDGKANILDMIAQAQEPAVTITHPQSKMSVTLEKTPHLAALFAQIDGRRPLREMLARVAAEEGASHADLTRQFTALYQAFHLAGWMYLRYPESSEVIYPLALQQRVFPAGGSV